MEPSRSNRNKRWSRRSHLGQRWVRDRKISEALELTGDVATASEEVAKDWQDFKIESGRQRFQRSVVVGHKAKVDDRVR